jgi:hypothetical protein
MVGPLVVSKSNPRYFAEPSGRIVYLAGSHTWESLQDCGLEDPPRAFDYDGYLAMLERHGHNFFRLWAWEQAAWHATTLEKYLIAPLCYERTGPGMALDGKPKFDITRWNPQYFARLRDRVIAACRRGIYVAVMLFQGWSIMKKDLGGKKKHLPGNPWLGHPLHRENNVNGVDGDANGNGEGEEVHTLAMPAITRLQETYVRKVVDTVNDLDNVLYEVTNESQPESKDWQYHIINCVHRYEATKPKQHPVGISAFYAGREGCMDAMYGSPAEWIAPQTEGGPVYRYDSDPPAADGRKIIISDTDHFGVWGADSWAWKSFTRGMNLLYMDPVTNPGLLPKVAADELVQASRRAAGQTRMWSERINLATMLPRGDLSSTRYCLADEGREYLVYQPETGAFQLRLGGSPAGGFSVTWLDPTRGTTMPGETTRDGGWVEFQPPLPGPAVLWLKRATP